MKNIRLIVMSILMAVSIGLFIPSTSFSETKAGPQEKRGVIATVIDSLFGWLVDTPIQFTETAADALKVMVLITNSEETSDNMPTTEFANSSNPPSWGTYKEEEAKPEEAPAATPVIVETKKVQPSAEIKVTREEVKIPEESKITVVRETVSTDSNATTAGSSPITIITKPIVASVEADKTQKVEMKPAAESSPSSTPPSFEPATVAQGDMPAEAVTAQTTPTATQTTSSGTVTGGAVITGQTVVAQGGETGAGGTGNGEAAIHIENPQLLAEATQARAMEMGSGVNAAQLQGAAGVLGGGNALGGGALGAGGVGAGVGVGAGAQSDPNTCEDGAAKKDSFEKDFGAENIVGARVASEKYFLVKTTSKTYAVSVCSGESTVCQEGGAACLPSSRSPMTTASAACTLCVDEIRGREEQPEFINKLDSTKWMVAYGKRVKVLQDEYTLFTDFGLANVSNRIDLIPKIFLVHWNARTGAVEGDFTCSDCTVTFQADNRSGGEVIMIENFRTGNAMVPPARKASIQIALHEERGTQTIRVTLIVSSASSGKTARIYKDVPVIIR